MLEGAFSPPVYNDLYNFVDGPQDDIFENSYSILPDPAPNAALPVLNLPTPPTPPTTTSASPPAATTSVSKPKSKTWLVQFLFYPEDLVAYKGPVYAANLKDPLRRQG